MSVVATAVFSGYMATAKVIKLAKAKITAVSLVNEKMEEIRNMPYDLVATEHGTIVPAGTLKDSEEFLRDGVTFILTRDIRYVDDNYDGNLSGTVVGRPTDLYPYDYKKVEITAKVLGKKGILATITSNLGGKAAETPSNTGIVKLCVVDSNSLPVDQANVRIFNPTSDPVVDVQATTGIDGCIFVPNLPPDSHGTYHLEATKSGHSTDMTYPRTAQNPNSLQPDLNVIVQQVTSQTLVIDTLGSMAIDVVDSADAPVANSELHIEGTKQKWFNPITLKYSADLMTDANGHIDISNMEFDDYTITMQGKIIATTSPYQPIGLKAGISLNVKIKIAANNSSLTIKSADPIVGLANTTVSLDVMGTNIDSSATIRLINSANQEIVGTGVSVSKGILTADFILGNATVGNYDIVIQNPDGSSIRQLNGFEVTK